MRWTYNGANCLFQMLLDVMILFFVGLVLMIASGFGWGCTRVANLTDATISSYNNSYVSDKVDKRSAFVIVNHGETFDTGNNWEFIGSASSPLTFYTKSYVGNKIFSYNDMLDACRKETKWQDFGIQDDTLKGKMHLYFSGGNSKMYHRILADIYSENYLELKNKVVSGDTSYSYLYFGFACNCTSSYYTFNSYLPDIGINVDIYRNKHYDGEFPLKFDFSRLCEVNALDTYAE